MPLVTLEQANRHLRAEIDLTESPPNDDAQDLTFKLAQAEAIILDYLKVADDSPEWQPAENDALVVQASVLIVLSALWDNREGGTDDGGGGGYLSQGGVVARLLARLRDPALA